MWWAYGGLATVVYATVQLLSFRRKDIHSWDLAIFEQAVKAYSRFEAPIVPVKGSGYLILGDHFSPVTALVAPIYRVFPSAQTLLIVHSLLIGLGVVFVARCAIRHLDIWWGTLIAFLFATSFGIQSAIAVDFHEVAFAVPLLALAGEAFVDGRFDRVAWWSLPLMFVKEDLGMTVAAIGVALWFAGERRTAILLGFAGVVGTFVTVWWIIPYFNSAEAYDYVATFGGSRGVPLTLLTDMDRKALTVLLTLAVGGLAVLWSPWTVAIIPTLAWRFAGDVDFYWGTDWHYSLVLMPIMFIGLIDSFVQHPQWRWAGALIAVGAGVFMWPGSPLDDLRKSETWQMSPRAHAADRALAVIPAGSHVEADIGLLSHLVSDNTVYWRGTIGDAQPDYIIFDKSVSTDNIVSYALEAHHKTFKIIHDDRFFVVAQRPDLK